MIGGKDYGNVTEVENDNVLVPQFSLCQNFPNPFNPVTTISYGLDVDAFVNLDIYNIVGEKVVTLVNDFQNPGYHNVYFNASNLSSGIYFIKLVSNSRTLVKKMVLLK